MGVLWHIFSIKIDWCTFQEPLADVFEAILEANHSYNRGLPLLFPIDSHP